MDRSELLDAAAALFKALSSPTRLAILRELETGHACVHELVLALGASQPLVSQHLLVLRNARLVQGARRGKEVEYSVIDTHISGLLTGALAHVGEQDGTEAEHSAEDEDAVIVASSAPLVRPVRREHP